jgi:hypothetical protein
MDLTQQSFDLLLSWLHPNPEEAGREYVKIRAGLIKNFASHGCKLPDRLADITIDRVARKLPKIFENYEGKREPYFQRVAYYVLLEYYTHDPGEVEISDELPLVAPDEDEDVEIEFDCLDKCMKGLTEQKRYVIENYYQGDKGVKIRRRKELALSLNLELPALRVIALRIRKDLKSCIMDCLQAQSDGVSKIRS